MKIGIDFGTSYSAAAARIGDALVHIQFDGQPQFRTAVFFPTTLPDLDAFELDDAMEAEVDALMRGLRNDQARAGGTPRPATQLRRDAIRIVRRQWLEARMRDAESSAADLQHAVFGEAAIESYLLEGSGNLVQSPKSMLGFNLHPRAKETITGIAAHILEHIRLTASQQLGATVRAATLGRPVRFRSSLGEAGGEQALALLRDAAAQAGFDSIEFLEEPAAAALHYHATSPQRHTTLVVDIGGGTTDIALAEIGGDGAPRVHRAWGVANGGTDVDLALSMAQVMPLFGKGASRIPVHHFVEAATVQDMPRQRDFHKRDFGHVDAPFGARLQALQRDGGTTRLYRGVEGMKVRLSGHDEAGHALDYIEPGLRVDATRDALETASARFLDTIGALLDDVRGDLDAPPDSLFLTGGMSGAPYVQAAAQARFPDARIVRGDPSLGVVSGLAEHARN